MQSSIGTSGSLRENFLKRRTKSMSKNITVHVSFNTVASKNQKTENNFNLEDLLQLKTVGLIHAEF